MGSRNSLHYIGLTLPLQISEILHFDLIYNSLRFQTYHGLPKTYEISFYKNGKKKIENIESRVEDIVSTNFINR